MNRRKCLWIGAGTFVSATAIAVAICLTGKPTGSGATATQAVAPRVDIEKVRRILNYGAEASPGTELMPLGENAFPAYEAILAAPKNTREVSVIFYMVRHVKGDRRRFLEPALRALTHSSNDVREEAALLLAEIGSNSEASPLVALLSDKDFFVARAAAKTLAAIGGPREVLAMDVWLRGVPAEKPGKEVVEVDNERPSDGRPRRSHDTDERLRQRVREYRDALQKRLDAERIKEEKKPKKNDGNK